MGPDGRVNAPETWTQEDVALFLQAGGVVLLSDWVHLDAGSREAFAAVGRAHLADQLTALAEAIRDPEFSSRLSAEADGGRMREQGVMAQALTLVGAKIAQGRGP